MGTITSSSISNILTILLNMHNMTESKLSRAVNLPRATINKIRAGKINDPRSSTLILIANYFNVSVDQLIGNMPLINGQIAQFTHIPILNSEQFKHIDLSNANKIINFSTHNDWLLFDYKANIFDVKNLFAFRVYGDAMTPMFDEHTIVIIDKSLKNKKFSLIHSQENDEVILRQVFTDGKLQILKPLNDLFRSINIMPEDRILGGVVAARRSFMQ